MKHSRVRRSLMCKGPTAFEVELTPRRQPAANEIEVDVAAASVNPIDARRAEGNGRRLFTLLGAGRLRLCRISNVGRQPCGELQAGRLCVRSEAHSCRGSPTGKSSFHHVFRCLAFTAIAAAAVRFSTPSFE